MPFRFPRALLLAGAVASLALPPALAQDKKPDAAKPAEKGAATPAPEDPVVARVNGQEVRRSEVVAAMQALGPQIQQMPMEVIYPALLDQVVNARIVTAEGYKLKLQDGAEVKARLKSAEERFVQEAWLRRQIDAKLTDAKLKAEYDKYIKENPPEDEVRARHILVKTKEEAEALIKQIKGGADFAKLAGEQKIDTAAAGQQGDLGYFTKGQMVAPFAEAAFKMKPGEVSQAPVETQFGWHVIKLEEKRKSTPPTFEQAAPELRQKLAQDIAGEAVDALRKTAKVETFNIDGSPMAKEPAAPAAAAKPADKK